MPRRSRIENLPDEVREELHARLRDSHFTGFVELAAWLGSLGYGVGKSSIHRYATQNRQLIKAGKGVESKPDAPAAKIADQRLECLKAALQMTTADKARDLADSLLRWAYR